MPPIDAAAGFAADVGGAVVVVAPVAGAVVVAVVAVVVLPVLRVRWK